MYLHTWLSMCLPPTQSLSPERYSKVDLGASNGLATLGCQYCQLLPLAPKHSGPPQADPCLTHTSKSSP